MKLTTTLLSLIIAALLVCSSAYAKKKERIVVCPDGSTASSYSACPDFRSEEVSRVEEKEKKGGEEEEEEEEYKWEEEDWSPEKEYRRLYYTFGVGGHYFAKKDGVGITSTVGAYSCFEYRFSKALSVGFDTYYGWVNGSGTQYLSSFNPGLKIFPMMYKNPNIEPFFFVGGHAFDAAFGGSSRGGTSYGQGAFAGAGARFFFGETRFGMEVLARASFLWMDRSSPATGRAFSIPIFFMLGFAY